MTDAFIHSGSRIGFSRVIGCGSEVVLDACDFLAYCLDDPETHSVILFMEGFKRPERFLALADHALELGKPIMVVKVGRSPQAQAAAVAHSGSLAGEDRATDAALRAAGVIRCDDLDELLETAELVAGCRRLGRSVGRGRTGVVTVSTGEASLIADLAPRTGIDLPPVPAETRARLLRDLPTLGYVGNPLDPWGATDPTTAYAAAFDAFADSGAYDVLAIVHDFPYRSLPGEVEVAHDVTDELIRATADRPELMPVYISLTSGEPPPETKRHLDEAGGVHIDRVKPAPNRRVIPGGFTIDDFTVDHAARSATCPNGLTRPISRTGFATFGTACAACPLRARCTRSRKGKKLKVGPHDERLRAARQAARDPQWLAEYRQHRPMVERTIAWLTRGNRKLRYRGIAKNDHWLHHRAAALNLGRLIKLGLLHDGTAWALA